MREEFEQWYLQVVKGHPNNLAKDAQGWYVYVGPQYLAFEAATMIERAKWEAVGFGIIGSFGRARAKWVQRLTDMLCSNA